MYITLTDKYPTEAGIYICKRPCQVHIEVAVLRKVFSDEKLTFFSGLSIFPYEQLEEGVLWSEEIIIL
jgi:hypothetical protein